MRWFVESETPVADYEKPDNPSDIFPTQTWRCTDFVESLRIVLQVDEYRFHDGSTWGYSWDLFPSDESGEPCDEPIARREEIGSLDEARSEAEADVTRRVRAAFSALTGGE